MSDKSKITHVVLASILIAGSAPASRSEVSRPLALQQIVHHDIFSDIAKLEGARELAEVEALPFPSRPEPRDSSAEAVVSSSGTEVIASSGAEDEIPKDTRQPSTSNVPRLTCSGYECRVQRVSWFGLPKTLNSEQKALNHDADRIRFNAPTLAPMAHTMFCLKYPGDCRVRKISFRGTKLKLTPKRWRDLVTINAEVNRSIRPQPNTRGLAGEEWLISPRSGDCNDYAVTKRHELLVRGWPSYALLLAEVVVGSGEHHLVLVVRTSDGDFVLDNLNAAVRPWTKARYHWVRVQSPLNPKFWLTTLSTSA